MRGIRYYWLKRKRVALKITKRKKLLKKCLTESGVIRNMPPCREAVGSQRFKVGV